MGRSFICGGGAPAIGDSSGEVARGLEVEVRSSGVERFVQLVDIGIGVCI